MDQELPQQPVSSSKTFDLTPVDTGFPELNALLGGGIVPGSIVLIKGGPGAGKTTLATQIIANAASGGRTACAYIGFEEGSSSALRKLDIVYPAMGLGKLVSDGWIAAVETEQLGLIAASAQNHEPVKLLEAIQLLIEESTVGQYDIPAGKHIGFVVVDSLTALMQTLMGPVGKLRSERVAMQIICRYLHAMRHGLERTSLLLIAERESPVTTMAVESYIADCVIDLSTRAVKRRPSIVNAEDLRYCTVSKSRHQPKQDRSCCYDFANRTGIRFYPTYAAEGLVSLFWENEPQKDSFFNFKNEDVAMLYPMVEVEEFTRAALQRTFAIRRHETEIPDRKPMSISNMDEYWVMETTRPEHSLLLPVHKEDVAIYSLDRGSYNFVKELLSNKPFLHPAEGSVANQRGALSEYWTAIPFTLNIGMFAYRKDICRDFQPKDFETWEQIEGAYAAGHIPKHCKFLIETRTYDSLLVFVFEWLWSHGAHLKVKNGSIDLGPGSFEEVVEAMCRLNRWIFELEIIPHFSSVEPAFCEQNDWALARHWYSTLVELLCERKAEAKPITPRKLKNGADLAAEVGVCRIPISKGYKTYQKINDQELNEVKHHSAWGEWYLAIERGTENVALGHDLISNLMSQRRIVERAFTGAGLPPVEEFYGGPYGYAKCPWVDMTFRDIKATFYNNAISRTEIENYANEGLKLYGACSAIVSVPMHRDQIAELMLKALVSIDPHFK